MHGVQLSARKPGGKGKPATAQRGSLLFSHRGVTGPAVLDLSHHAVMALERRTPMPGAAGHREPGRLVYHDNCLNELVGRGLRASSSHAARTQTADACSCGVHM